MSDFSIVSRNTEDGYRGPGGQCLSEKYWEDLSTPDCHASLRHADSLIPQIDQRWPGGKGSCFLTSQLNALAIRGEFDYDTIQNLQQRFVDDPDYTPYWSPIGSEGRLAWTSKAHDLAFALHRLGTTIRLEAESMPVTEAVKTMEGRLRDGNVAILLGQSATGGHARLAFEPLETPGELFVHDPNNTSVTGMYGYEDLASFHDQDRVVIY